MTDQMNNKPAPQGQSVPREAIADAAAAGIELLEGEIPMSRSMRRRIGLLEMVLQQIATGQAVLAAPTSEGLQSSREGQDDAPPEGDTPPRKRTASKRK